ncbi:SipW-dependent-type signal peptide-containing protein [Paenarthrobacter sp. NPDC057981]|uniref:SipW-dependent-type signal peptide-containing protein n=1 Tax=Paenarthrobacter sp. NPDC057981 TaxID=3346297 RepID=UPI0036DF4548
MSSNKATKVRALLAGGLVLGVGAAFTLAAWTDNEWVFGNSGGDKGPGTLTYHMEQNTFSNTNGTGADAWSDKPNIPTVPSSATDGALTFGAISAALKPGDTAYAPMQLRAAAGSEALTATLAEAVKLGGNGVDTATNSLALYNALTYRAVQGVTPANCAAGNLTGGTDIVGSAAASVPLTTVSATPISLAKGADSATAGAPVNLCFAITLPSAVTDVTLQGKQTVPLWRFTSIAGS